MFRRNLFSQYKQYTKNIKALKEKVTKLDYQQILQDARSTVGSNIKEKLVVCSSTTKGTKTNNEPPVQHNIYNKRLEELRKQLRDAGISNINPVLKQLKSNAKALHTKMEQIKTSTNHKLATTRLGLYSAVGVTATVTSEEPLKVVEPSTPEATLVIEPIPEPPPIPDPEIFAETINPLNALGEPTLASLGLGGWTPRGMVQQCLEYLHVAFNIPWWEAIVIGTVIVRFLMFPLVVIAQRNAAKMNNYLPQLQLIQLKMTEARQTGNQLEAARYSQEMMIFMKEKELNPLKNMIVPLAQMPLFISFFMGLRKMANLPVDTLREGGMLWFTDLTVPDQYYALPIITSLTLWTTIELGTDSAKLSSQNLQTMKYVLRALPLVILPFTVNFPGAILCYWVASNFISLAQVGFLRIPKVRDYFKIEPLIKHDTKNLPVKNKGFVGGIKDSWTNIKLTKELEERRRYDEVQFQRAGRGPVVKTYRYDPTKQVNNNPNAINAKKR